jgi:PIN domain nuclease of toxin-antitoxin system
MEYLADTVTIVRHFSKKGRIPTRTLRILRDADQGKHTIAISVVSLIEILYLSERKRIPLDLEKLSAELSEQSNYRVVDLDPGIVNTARSVQGLELHDRMIVATAKHLDLPILTPDTAINERSDIEVVWD